LVPPAGGRYGSIDADNVTIPLWVKFAAATAIALGTYMGGWRIIRTFGHRLTGDVETPQGLSAESSAGAVILASSYYGFPLSTTQITSGAVMGSGVGKRLPRFAGVSPGAWSPRG
jgi:PiT family inorganic phosphate transporter